jgi:hypothetical protein
MIKKAKYFMCIANKGYPASLELRKVYESLPDPVAEKHGEIRVVDESGEDYLYPRKFFTPIQVPRPAVALFAHAV